MDRFCSLLPALILAALLPSTGAAQEVPQHPLELGIQAGFFLPDQDLSGKDSAVQELEPTGGARLAVLFAKRWDWYIDTTYSDVNTNLVSPVTMLPIGDVEAFSARTGVDFYFRPHGKKVQWFVNGGLGWIDVDVEFVEDFSRELASIGFGQRVKLDGRASFRWEIRGDRMFDDNDLAKGEDLHRTYGLIGISWGLGPSHRDSDGDGVLDRRDDCPDTPPGAIVDEHGCPKDSDGDGVYDGIDRCPNTPRGATVDEWGCPKDSDGDGVYDGIDQCPNTPPGAIVDERGCPKDSDGDGVYDGIDKCPDTPRGTPVRPDGCPKVEPLFKPEKQTLILEGVFFELDRAVLKPESQDTLDRVAQSLLDWEEVRVEIAGHTDWTGTEEYNMDLSHRRAGAVKDYLIKRSVAADRMTVKGYGETRPIADNHSKAGRAKNRRVELKKLR